MQRWFLGLCLSLAACCFVACGEKDDGTSPSADTTLPPLHLTDETPALLLTWIDERGASHTTSEISAVPEGSKDQVRVVTREAGHGSLFYVADLTQKGEDGSYPVHTMTRTEWEQMIDKRRDAYRAKHAPPPLPQPSHGPAPGPEPPPP